MISHETLINKLTRITDWLSDSVGGRIAVAFNDCVEQLTPFLLVAGIFNLLLALPVPGWQALISSFSSFFVLGIDAVFSSFWVMFAVLLAIRLANALDLSLYRVSSLSMFSCYLLGSSFNLQSLEYSFDGLNSESCVLIIAAVLITVLCIKLEKDLTERLTVSRLISRIISYALWFGFPVLLLLNLMFGFLPLIEFFYSVQNMLAGLINCLPFLIIILLIELLFAFEGIGIRSVFHGIAAPILVFCLGQNALAAANSMPVPYIYTEGFALFGFRLGGAGGIVVGLRLAIRLVKSKALLEQKEIIKETKGKISEFYLYGIPLCQNPVFACSFIVLPVLLEAASFILIQAGLISPVIALAKWNLLPGVSAFIMTGGDWRAVIWQLLEVGILFIGYLIPLKIWDRKLLKEESMEESE